MDFELVVKVNFQCCLLKKKRVSIRKLILLAYCVYCTFTVLSTRSTDLTLLPLQQSKPAPVRKKIPQETGTVLARRPAPTIRNES